ncbi:cation-transporting P-type ATPase, partial [Candidatus Dojkabacteria bacterium]|nr:cation-transporting P-type ATPase [Candidatus Dojkabacteria bacterium]
KSNILQSIPFNAVQKFSVSLVKEADKYTLVFLGAPDILLEHSSLNQKERITLHEHINTLAYSGERILGVASKEIEYTENFSLSKDLDTSNLVIDGLLTFRDPIRPKIEHTIKKVAKAGIKTIILTGDHQGTAISVAKEVGLQVNEESILDASELTKLSPAELAKKLPKLTVISRVTPFDKLKIVKLYQSMGEIVAMTGDGVNDAPSIKQANVGIAMGSGTEVAQSVADLILLDDNFETIVAAIEEGRQILGNIRKVLVYLLTNVMDGLILIGGSLLTGLPLPMNALQILWVNFFTDSFPAIAFAFEKEADTLSLRPHKGKLVLFDPLMRFLIIIIGTSTSALLFVLYFILLKLGFDENIVRTFTFAAFGTYTLLVALSVRSLDRSILSYPLLSNAYLTFGIVIGLILMAAAIYIPMLQQLFGTVALPIEWVFGVLLVGILNIVLIESGKKLFRILN